MIKRKYNYYKIKVTYLNEETETIEYKEKDKKSYKQMLELYNDTKDHYRDESVIIDFCGINEENELNVIFQKEIKGKDYEIKKEAEEIEEKDIYELISDLEKTINKIEKRKKHLKESENLFNKEQDVEFHKLDNNMNFTDQEKIQYFDNLNKIRFERRQIKNEYGFYIGISSFYTPTIENVIKMANILPKAKDRLNTHIEAIKELGSEAFLFIKKVSYRNYKERDNLLKQLDSKYDKVISDDINMVVMCYNDTCGKKSKKNTDRVIIQYKERLKKQEKDMKKHKKDNTLNKNKMLKPNKHNKKMNELFKKIK